MSWIIAHIGEIILAIAITVWLVIIAIVLYRKAKHWVDHGDT